MSFSKKRRFIAGAVCPRCSAMDSIMVYDDDGVDVRACVECDFKERANFEELDSKKPVAPKIERELPTRVNQGLFEAKEQESKPVDNANEVQVVKIIDGLSEKKN